MTRSAVITSEYCESFQRRRFVFLALAYGESRAGFHMRDHGLSVVSLQQFSRHWKYDPFRAASRWSRGGRGSTPRGINTLLATWLVQFSQARHVFFKRLKGHGWLGAKQARVVNSSRLLRVRMPWERLIASPG